MLKEKRERRERTDNYHLLQQWCRTPEQRLEENPLLGEWRMYAALKQLGISVSPRTCGRIMAENRRLYGIKPKPEEPHKPKPHPFKATARHERWCVDIRYIEKHRIPEIKGSFYVITVMDAFSRAILSSDIFQSQDLSCVLIVLYAAVEQFGAPLKLITDNGGVFRAKQLLAICEALEIEKEYIHPRQSWENLVETHFNVMRRMSQVHFEQVTSWQGAKIAHERFVTDYNAQPHWAHRKRDDNRLSPAEVLGEEKSKLRTPEQLHRIFYATRFLRRLNRLGYVHFRRWKLYGEEALARHPRKHHWLSIPFAINQIKSTSKQCQRPDDLKPLIALRKGGSGNWMRPYGISPSGFLTMLFGENDETRPCRFNYPCWKIRKQLRSNRGISRIIK